MKRANYISHWKKQKATKGIRKLMFKWYKIPLGTEVEIINKDMNSNEEINYGSWKYKQSIFFK